MSIQLARPYIGDEEREAVDAVLRSGGLAQGPQVAAFEDEFSALVDGRHCVAVSSGTTALHLGLLAAGIGAGDEVIVPSFSFAATANSVRLCGAEPVFVDIDPSTFCIDPLAVEAAIGPKTAAVMPVHLYGHPAAMDQLGEIAERAGLALVEDAAQAHGAALNGRHCGAFGKVAAFSFYPTKNMTTGEGGMVVTDDESVARNVRLLRNQGMEQRYQNEIVGFNARMTDIGAAIGRVQLRRLPDWTASRQRNAERLSAGITSVEVPYCAHGAEHVYHQYTVRSPDRAALEERLRAAGIGFGVYYPTPIHRLPAYDLSLDLPETERAVAEVLSLPVHPFLDDSEIARIIEAVNG
jgi:dTDP-4-amino-4,6-dideoxygalactose transaminase